MSNGGCGFLRRTQEGVGSRPCLFATWSNTLLRASWWAHTPDSLLTGLPGAGMCLTGSATAEPWTGTICNFGIVVKANIAQILDGSQYPQVISVVIRASLGARAYPWILSKYFLSVRPSVRVSIRAYVRPPTDKHRGCILCVKLYICVVF